MDSQNDREKDLMTIGDFIYYTFGWGLAFAIMGSITFLITL